MGQVSAKDEIEDELEKMLKRIADSNRKPDPNIIGMCTRYISLCFQTENLSRHAIQTIERILDVMEIRLKSPSRGAH